MAWEQVYFPGSVLQRRELPKSEVPFQVSPSRGGSGLEMNLLPIWRREWPGNESPSHLEEGVTWGCLLPRVPHLKRVASSSQSPYMAVYRHQVLWLK